MGLKEDLEKTFKKYGLQADGEGDVEQNQSDAGNDDAKESESNGDSNGSTNEPQADQSEVVANLSENIARKFAEMVANNKKLSQGDQKSLETHVKTKIFTNWGGIKEIEYPTDLSNLTKEEKIVTFFKSLYYSKSDPASAQVVRALVEGTDAEGGYLVPEELRSEVFRILPDISIMRRIARVIPMASDTLLLNTLTARPYAYWTAEYASKSTTSAEFGQVTLNSNDLVCLLPVTDQLIADANINIVQFIIELFTEAIAAEEDAAFFTGSGTGRPKGINQESLTTVAGAAGLSFDTIIALIDAVPQRVTQSPGAAFVGHRRVKSNLRKVKDTTNNYIWRDGGANNGQVGRLPDTVYGYPFYEQNDLSEDELYFGDWRNYIIGDRQAISVRTTQEGGEAWRRNATEIKAVERVDGRAVLTAAFAKVTDV